MASDPSFVPSNVNIDVEGDITVPGAPDEEEEPSTLDEPVLETLKRDFKNVGKKFFHVLLPRQSKTLLRDWDLWGPLVLCVFLAMLLQGHKVADSNNDGGPQFAEVFVVVWVGSFVITINSKLLGGQISFFQSVCVLGYCIFPLDVALVVCRIILLAKQNLALFIVRFLIVILGFAWATFASIVFLGDSQPPNRKALAVYPIFLFYFVISWMIISNSG
ncbi:protein YIPF6 [Exaiptasia diaphana]|uniref:Protein YIPF n=1 Tax=Exaiptasia diaphana TaxID=2652724 RepID=A0A913Y4K5_EXADI|nr:protein YIPF6 [Exaiptasia diaphana]KXJ22882.1 Protein YIPF6 [Exaiptasia diaphana]